MKHKTVIAVIAITLLLVIFSACSSEEVEIVDYYTPGEYLVTNVGDSYRLLKLTPVLVLNRAVTTDAAFQAELTLMTPAMRDAINIVVRMKTEDEMRSAGILDELRVEIAAALQEKLGMDYITYIYFSDFVLQ